MAICVQEVNHYVQRESFGCDDRAKLFSNAFGSKFFSSLLVPQSRADLTSRSLLSVEFVIDVSLPLRNNSGCWSGR